MNREQIIDALERCVEFGSCGTDCPYFDNPHCSKELRKDALSLIRAQAEDYTELDEKYRVLYSENERLKTVKHLLQQDLDDRDKMLEKKVEDVYADFMQDYNLMREELDGCYEENARLRELPKRLTDFFKNDDTLKYIEVDAEYICEQIDNVAEKMLEGLQ